MRNVLFILSTFAILSSTSYAQSISGQLHNQQQERIPYVNVSLIKLPDSTNVYRVLSDSTGKFRFDNLQHGNYLVKVNAMGYRPHLSHVIRLTPAASTQLLGSLVLVTKDEQLHGVTITGRKPVIEQQLDRMVMNVEGTVLSEGSSALELLGKSPGVTVNDNGGVAIKGRTGSVVMINCKPTYLSGDQLMNLLRSTPSSDVSRIEIIANPSAKEDAAGNGGIVNIVLKKPVRAGLNGNISLNGGAGRGARAGGSLSLNYRTAKVNLFGTYNQYFANYENRTYIRRDFTAQYSEQFTKVLPQLGSNNFRAGLDWTIDSANSIGVMVSGGFGKFPTQEPTTNNLYGESLLQKASTLTVGKQRWQDMLYNLNYVHLFNNKGHKLSADLDYVYHFDRMDQQLDTRYNSHSGQLLRPASSRVGDIPSTNNIYAAKVDYTLPLTHNINVEAGWKGSLVRMENNLVYDTLAAEGYVKDNNTSNHFVYKEQIQAGYLNIKKEWQSFTVQVGLRGEYTHTKGEQLTLDTTFTRSYFQLFPSLFFSHTTKKDNKWQLGYSRRIQRPTFWDMNPFRVYEDPFSYYEGNAQLVPSLVHAVELGYSYRSLVHTVVNYSRATNVVSTLIGLTSGNVTYQTPANIGTSTNVGVSITASKDLFSWWSSNNVVNLYYNTFEISHTKYQRTTFTWNSQQTFTLTKGWKAELNGFYNSGGLDGLITLYSRYQVSTGVQKSVFHSRGHIKLMVNDVTKGNINRYRIAYSDLKLYNRYNPDSRYAVLSFTYRLGKGTMKDDKRETSGEALKDRLK
ncbi:Outer membrane receptor proteins, mostly Fe transport [Chitinophaga sp. YR627]|uniref:outer membrane beta-barrel family protein n=1 Tax=Chitinophaga sp. YR627 TaxID=1881041 RepID=UPI0008EA4FE0|nr:outer membrane beta-barrel family protein [Chitinophaga sp. YR627]SFM86206.1 Outer membrane receptor proteins, mostly Fe transport [Chitinophaga sp. YR627]